MIFSQILRLQLGGKAYQPDRNCPIVKNSKALQEFIKLMEKCQQIVEEEKDSKKGYELILKTLRTNFLRTKGCLLPRKSVEAIHQKLNSLSIIEYKEKGPIDNMNKVASQTFEVSNDMRPCLKVKKIKMLLHY